MKLGYLLSGVIALGISTSPVLPVIAQSTTPNNSPRMEKKWEAELNLTEAQTAQIEQIKQSTQSQIEAVLTPEQRAQWQAAKQNGQGMRRVFTSLNLTDAQKTSISN